MFLVGVQEWMPTNLGEILLQRIGGNDTIGDLRQRLLGRFDLSPTRQDRRRVLQRQVRGPFRDQNRLFDILGRKLRLCWILGFGSNDLCIQNRPVALAGLRVARFQ